MIIINAKKLFGAIWNGWKWYENSYCLDADCFILTGHKGGHANTKLFVYKDSVYTKILHEWCDANGIGLEDPSLCLANDGWWYLSAEAKPYDESKSQTDIVTFKSKNILSGWVQCKNLTIKPTFREHENFSMSSPKNYYWGNNEILQVYECRNHNWWNKLTKKYSATVGYVIINTKTDKITFRSKSPMSHEDIVADDLIKKGVWLMSVHEYNAKIEDSKRRWFASVYRSNSFDNNYKLIYIPKFNGNTIGELYFTKTNRVYFWESNDSGMYEGTLNSGGQPPTNGGTNVRPKIKLEDDRLSVIDRVVGVEYAWQVVKPGNNIQWFGFGHAISIPQNYKVDGYQFFCYPMPDGELQSNYVTYGSVINPDPDPDPIGDDDVIVSKAVLLKMKELNEDAVFLIDQELNK